MKRSFPNLTDTITADYIRNLAAARKLKRYWGTTTKGGIEVMEPYRFYYPSMDTKMKKLAKFLGMYEDLKRPMEGVESAWLNLNRSKASGTFSEWSSASVATNLNTALNRVIASGKPLQITIGAYVKRQPNKVTVIPPEVTTPITNQAGITAELLSKYATLWDTGYSIHCSSPDPYIQALALYMLRIGDITFNVTKVTKSVSLLDGTGKLPTGAEYATTNATDAYVLHVQVDPVQSAITPSSAITSAVVGAGESSNKAHATTKLIKSRLVSESSRSYGYIPPAVTPSSFWVTIPGQGTYLRASFWDNPDVKTKDKVSYFTSIIGSDYEEEEDDSSWFEILIAVVIVVVGFVLAGPAGSAVGGGLLGAATVLVVATLYISIAMYALAQMGATNVASSMGKFLNTVNPLVQIASVFLVVASIWNFAADAAKQAATQAAAEGAKQSVADLAIAAVKSAVTESMSAAKLSKLSMKHVLKLLDFTLDIYQKREIKDLESSIKDYRTQLAELEEAEEKAATTDVIKNLMASYPQLIAKDSSVYASLYDRPYEWWSTPYHTGNIQATSVTALWLSS